MKRITPATLTFGVMAIMGLLVSAYVVRNLLARDEKAPEAVTRNMPTPVADIPAGTIITDKHLGTAPALISSLTPDMLATKTVIVGRAVKEPLKKAVPIRAQQLYAPGERPPLKISKGKEAVTISLDSNTAIVDGLIKPGDYCDVQFAVNASNLRDDRIPSGYQMTLFKGIKVLAINRSTTQQDPETNGNTVTLEARPGQARALLLAEKSGTLTLTYTTDSTPGGVPVSDDDNDRLTIEKLLNLPPREAPPAPRPPETYTVDEYRLLRRSTISFMPNGRVLDYSNGYGINGIGTPWLTSGAIAPTTTTTTTITRPADPYLIQPVSPVAPATPNANQVPSSVVPANPGPATPPQPGNPAPPNPGPVGPSAGIYGSPNTLQNR